MINKISRLFKKFAIHQRTKKKIICVNNAPVAEEYEHCVVCGALTCVPISIPVDWRKNYVIGCGQLCVECAKKQQKALAHENTLTNAQIMLAIEQSRKNKI